MEVLFGGLEPTWLEAEELRRRMALGESFSILDARSDKEFEESRKFIPLAIRLPPHELIARRSDIPRGMTPVLVADVADAQTLAVKLMQQGYENIYVVEGGFDAWERAGGAVTRRK